MAAAIFVGASNAPVVDLVLEVNAGLGGDEDGRLPLHEILQRHDAGDALEGIRQPGFIMDGEVEPLVIRAQAEIPVAAFLVRASS